MKKTNIYSSTVIRRMNDTEYIKHLELSIEKIDKNIESFIAMMDSAVFERKPLDVEKAYVENIDLLRLK